MAADNNIHDVTIIGGGPVGMFTAFYAGMRQMSVKLIDSLPELGGQLTALYPEKYIYDIAGFPKVKAQNLVQNLYNQMKRFDPEVYLGSPVAEVNKRPDGIFELKTRDNQLHYSRSIIITAGNGAFQPRELQLPETKKYNERNLHYFITDMSRFKGKRIAIFGGGDSAVDWALMLEAIAEEVTLIHRRDQFRAHEDSVERLKKSSVRILTPFLPERFIGEDKIRSIVIQEVRGTNQMKMNVDDVIVNYGFISQLGPIKDWGLEIEKNSLVVNSKMETNIEGIYAVGDICTYEGKVKLIATGFGEVPIAVSNAKVRIDPNAKLQTTHSTTLMEKLEKKPVTTF